MNENEMNRLENQLRSWQPRRPSPKLKRRLFPAAARRAAALSLGWLAPAVACLILTLAIANQENRLSAGSSRPGPLTGVISSNLSYTNIHPQEHNRILSVSFEWTNLSDFTSSISPFSPGRQN